MRRFDYKLEGRGGNMGESLRRGKLSGAVKCLTTADPEST